MNLKLQLIEKALNTYREVITVSHFAYIVGRLDLFWSDILGKDNWPRNVEEHFGSIQNFITVLENEYRIQNGSPNKFKSKKVLEWIDQEKLVSSADYFNRYLKYLCQKGINVNALQADVINILNGCGDPSGDSSFLHKGLVYGEVQSGKTANYAGVINLAFDLGYKLVIVLAGITNKLRDQTEARLVDSVSGKRIDRLVGVGLIDFNERLDKVRLISGDVSTNQSSTLMDVVRDNDSLLFVVKKNPNSLLNLIKLITSLKGQADLYLNSCLIIDDECDHASLRSMGKKEYEAYVENNNAGEFRNSDDMLKAINARIRIILSLMYRCSYVGYTATPYSVVLQRSSDIQRNYIINETEYVIDENTDLFPEDFITLIRPGRGYFGLSEVFKKSSTENFILLRERNAEELMSKQFFTQKFYEFLIQTYVIYYRNDIHRWFDHGNKMIREKFSIMMIHPDYRVNSINDTASLVYSIYSEVLSDFGDLSKSKRLLGHLNTLLSDFRRDSRLILGGLSFEVEEDLYVFPDIIDKSVLWKIMNKIEFVVLHSSNESPTFNHLREVDYESPSCPLIQIVIGGSILSRGTTFPGLVSTILAREATRADSLYQMARWNGYRLGYEDVIRIDMLDSIASNFRVVSKIDETLRNDLYSLKDEYADLRPEDWELSVLNLVRRYETRFGRKATFRLTGEDRIRSAIRTNIIRSGHTIFLNDYSLKHLESNYSVASKFISTLNQMFSNVYEKDYRNFVLPFTQEYYSRVFLNVNRNLLKDFLFKYESGRIMQSRELLDCFEDENVKFNVVIKSLKTVNFRDDGLCTIHYIQESDSFENVPVSVVGRSILRNTEDSNSVRITSILDSDKERHIDLINNSERSESFRSASPVDQKLLMKEYRQQDNSCLVILYFVNNSSNVGDLIYPLRDGQVMAIPYLILPRYKNAESVLIRA